MKSLKPYVSVPLLILASWLSVFTIGWAALWLQTAISGDWFQAVMSGTKSGLPTQFTERLPPLSPEKAKELSSYVEEVKYQFFPMPKIILVITKSACRNQDNLQTFYWAAMHSPFGVGEIKMDGPDCLDANHGVHYEMW